MSTRARILALAGGRSSLRGVLARLVVAVGVILAILVGVAIGGTLWATGDYREAGVRAVAQRGAANQILIDLLNAETGLRGYTITGRPDYLAPYSDALKRYPRDVQALDQAIAGQSRLQFLAGGVDAAGHRWFAEAVTVLGLRRRGRTNEAISRVTQGIAKRRSDAFRIAHRALVAEVERHRVAALGSADRRLDITLALVGAGGVLALFVAVAATVLLWRRIGGPVADLAQGVRRVAEGELSEQVPRNPEAVRELAQLVAAFNEMQDDLGTQRDAVAGAARRDAALATERRLWETVQRGLLPERLPALPGYRLVAHYQPAEPGLLVGGDFYDATLLADGRLALLVGDMAGSGAAVAARAAGLRFGWRSLVEANPRPESVLAVMNREAAGVDEKREGLFASLLYVLLHPDGRLDIAPCGHPPPLVLHAAGCEEVQIPDPGPLLGVIDDATWPITRTVLPPGATLVLYTDGLVEARSDGDLFGVDRAAALLWEERRAPVELRVTRLVEAALRHGSRRLRDDVVVLAVERVDPSARAGGGP